MSKALPLLVALMISIGSLTSCARGSNSKPPDNTAQATEFVNLLVKSDFAGARDGFDDTMKSAMSEDQLKQLWQSLVQQYGPFQKILGTKAEKTGGFNMVYVTCKFEKQDLAFKVVYDSSGQIGGLWIVPPQPTADYEPPSYTRPESFHEKQVTVDSGEWKLPGMLTIPNGKGLFPAVVLVHGSGPNDCDETIIGNKPFKDIAWGLASQGIAVLRYDKRTKVYGAKLASIKNFTVEHESIDDALAAVSLLRHTEEIDSRHIFVLGHSLGGYLAPRIGKADPGIAGLISLAGTARPLGDVMVEQIKYIASLGDSLSKDQKKQIADIEKQAARIKSGDYNASTPNGELFNVPASYWLDLRDYNPPALAKTLKQPILVLQGGRDYQVTKTDFDLWKKELSGKNNVVFHFYPSMSHLFIEGTGTPKPGDYEVAGHVSKTVIDDITKWIKSCH